jgi:hypothetical protein
MEARSSGNIQSAINKQKTWQLRILNPAKLSFKIKAKTSLDEQKLEICC